jgi:cobalt-zinc-cadmium efflux system protein
MKLKSAVPSFLDKDQPVLLFSTLLSLILLSLELLFSHMTNSLLLFSIGLIQLSLGAFILIHFLLKNHYSEKKRLVTALIIGFVLILLTGYIFIEVIGRLSTPPPIDSGNALIAAVFCVIFNLVLFKTLTKTEFTRFKFGTFKLPVWSMVFISFTVLMGTIIIYYTNFYFLDVLLSLILGIFILIRAGFMTIDAYWHIEELA